MTQRAPLETDDSTSWVLEHYVLHARRCSDPHECFRRALSEIMLAFVQAHGLAPLEARALLSTLAPKGAAPKRALVVGSEVLAAQTGILRDPTTLGDVYETLLGALAQGTRKRRGSYFTPVAVARKLVDRAFSLTTVREGLRVLDPAMGAGRFLLEALRFVPVSSLLGIDVDPVAVWVARTTVALVTDAQPEALKSQLCLGDALAERLPVADVVIGNPPWIAHAGRQSVSLDPAVRDNHRLRFRSFSGFPTTHGMFIEQASRALAPGGVLGLLVPTQVSDLSGYGATREALTACARVVEPLEELGFGQFEGVTEPTLMLVAQQADGAEASPRAWSIREREGAATSVMTASLRSELARMADLPRFPAEMFGEAGFQTAGELSKTHLSDWPPSEGRFSVPLREGRSVEPFYLAKPSCALDPDREALARAGARLRPPESYDRVDVVIRQTARYPIAAVHDRPCAFRNSLLACYTPDRHATVALLNSTLLRAVHLSAQRDGRQVVFPQLKVAHLRALPAPLPRSDLSTLASLSQQASAAQGVRHAAVQRFRDAFGPSVPKLLFRPEGATVPARADSIARFARLARSDVATGALSASEAYEQTLEVVRKAWSEYTDLLARIDEETCRLYGIRAEVRGDIRALAESFS